MGADSLPARTACTARTDRTACTGMTDYEAGRDGDGGLKILATYTIASLLLDYVHGLVPALHTDSIQWGRLTDSKHANWALVLLATSLPVGSICFGSDLVAKVLHHSTKSADSPGAASAQSAGDQAPRSTPDRPESASEQLTESAPTKVTEAPATAPRGRRCRPARGSRVREEERG
ncbi:hypothetical protein [Streptomyces sp. NPDC093089]|uniref:hypothetical protein n=1 Tax=Streptomyces sp. NPDC093089 TaxID=3366024 RepID=UPI00381AC16D